MNEIVIVPKTEFDDLKTKIDHIIKLVSSHNAAEVKQKIITNDQLIAQFGISKKTAQNWRTNGLITFKRVGRKIFYKTEDVFKTLENHSQEAFKNKTIYRAM